MSGASTPPQAPSRAPRPPAAPRPVAMLVHAYYEEDPRVRREAEALVATGRPVVVYALRRPGTAPVDRLDGVDVRRMDVQRHQGAPLTRYLAEYIDFLVRASLSLARDHRRERYAVVQVHSIPDFLAAAALPVRLAGVPVILDLHESMPDFFRYRFPRAGSPILYRALLAQESASLAIADAVITVNDALGERLVRRGVPPAKLTIVRNSPVLARFDPGAHPSRPFMADGTLRLVYAGALSPTYELDVAFRALVALRVRRPGLAVTLDLYGRDFDEVPLVELARALGLAEAVRFHGRIPVEAVPAALAAADVGLAPTRRNPFTDYSLSTKIHEYLAMAKPVVATRLPMVERTFAGGEVATYTAGDPDDLAGAVLSLVDEPAAREARVARGLVRVRELAWERESVAYLALVERLAGRRDWAQPAQ
jgi:glycosyltransferase involved in cell wall biosynthesis